MSNLQEQITVLSSLLSKPLTRTGNNDAKKERLFQEFKTYFNLNTNKELKNHVQTQIRLLRLIKYEFEGDETEKNDVTNLDLYPLLQVYDNELKGLKKETKESLQRWIRFM